MGKNIEIERKFLVKGDFAPFVTRKRQIVQGYICSSAGRTVRIRIQDDEAYLTIKGALNKNGFARIEYEYPIPVGDALGLLQLTTGRLIEKERNIIPFGNHIFEVDVFHGGNEGLVIAELELASENEPFDRPDWLGEEVTGDRRYYNAYLSQFSGS